MSGFDVTWSESRLEGTRGDAFRKILIKGLKPELQVHGTPADRELLWAEDMGNELYRIDSIPFLVKGISLDDVVQIQADCGDNQFGVLERVVKRGGHSTYRVKLRIPLDVDRHDAFHQLLRAIADLGCRTAVASPSFFAVDCPPTTNVHALYDVLEVGEDAGVWGFEEGHCSLNNEP